RDHRWIAVLWFVYCIHIFHTVFFFLSFFLDKASDSSQILFANNAIKNLAEGDVSVPQTENEIYCNNCRWPKPSDVVQVPYTISDSFSSSEKTTITNAIDEFHTSTCIRFVTRVAQNDYVNIVKEPGCSSYIGKVGGSQKLHLGPGCVKNGIVQHELIHALGFWHEQSRSDRDDYVRIHPENIIEGQESNFIRRDTNNLNIPYDYSSVMHYGRTDFSKNGQNTITPLIASVAIGQRIGMSESDVLKVNKLYNCRECANRDSTFSSNLTQTFILQICTSLLSDRALCLQSHT
uniref:Metalloendopeptidase n=1 Tax=Echeneis naucrates TaxID=173247 RepID=A0A665TWC6_ECHNA